MESDQLVKWREDCRHRLFEQYLPFWERGGYDREQGGFHCYLHDDGTVATPLKDIWYQGRGIWVYAYLYNHLDRDPQWLERAQHSRDFMVRAMNHGDGTWETTVDSAGRPAQGIESDRGPNIYGALFAAAGLLQLAQANGSEADLVLAKQTLRRSVARYNAPDYPGISLPGAEGGGGLRAQGHAFMLIWTLPQLLKLERDPWAESQLEEQLDALENRFWNEDFRISNEYLNHDYSRISGFEDYHYPGHSIEAQWMAMEAALFRGELERARRFGERFRHLVEWTWDPEFGGLADAPCRMLPDGAFPAGQRPHLKTMWAQSELMTGCLLAPDLIGRDWALEWYARGRDYLIRTMAGPGGFWHQSVDRAGNPVRRPGFSVERKENFHHPRCLMHNLQGLDRLLS